MLNFKQTVNEPACQQEIKFEFNDIEFSQIFHEWVFQNKSRIPTKGSKIDLCKLIPFCFAGLSGNTTNKQRPQLRFVAQPGGGLWCCNTFWCFGSKNCNVYLLALFLVARVHRRSFACCRWTIGCHWCCCNGKIYFQYNSNNNDDANV